MQTLTIVPLRVDLTCPYVGISRGFIAITHIKGRLYSAVMLLGFFLYMTDSDRQVTDEHSCQIKNK